MSNNKTFKSSFTHYDFFDKEYTVSEVLDFYTKSKSEKNYDGNLVKMNSQRYETFKEKGCKCDNCGREGTIFRLQRNYSDIRKKGRYHFGLWSDDNIQMTKDHIIPKCLGGTNNIKNYVTMCEECNFDKGNACTVEDIAVGEHYKNFTPKPQENIGAKPNNHDEITATAIKRFAIRMKKDDKVYQSYIQEINNYMIENNTNIYLLDSSKLDNDMIKKTNYIIEFYKKIITFAKADIGPKHRALQGIPKSISTKIINDVKIELELVA